VLALTVRSCPIFIHIVVGSVEAFLLVPNGEAGWWPTLASFVVLAPTGAIVAATALFALIAYAQVMKEM
jgi:formate-nitrite transporter family protein